jgi:hypothetical protein
MNPGTDAKWNRDANIASMRDVFPTNEFNAVQGEINNVDGKDTYNLPPIPDGHYDSSLSSVKDLGNIKKGENRQFLRKVALGGAIAVVTASVLMSYINSAKPTISEVNLSTSSQTLNYSFLATYSKASKLYISLLSEDKTVSLTNKYDLTLDSSIPMNGSNHYQTVIGSFTNIDETAKYTLTIKANSGYGSYVVYG